MKNKAIINKLIDILTPFIEVSDSEKEGYITIRMKIPEDFIVKEDKSNK